jgi:hypothetical protein
MYELTREELYRFHLDSKKSIAGYRLRKFARIQKILAKSRAIKEKAVSLMMALTVAPFAVQAFV